MPLQSKIFVFVAVLLLLIAFEWVFFNVFEGRVLVRTLAQLSAEPVLAATDREQEGWTYSGQIVDSMQIRHDPELMVAKAPITVMEQTLGMAEIVFSLNTLKGKVSRSRVIFLTIFISELLLAVGFAVFPEIQVIRPLGKLAGEVQEIRPDSLQMPLSPAPFSAKEIGRLYSASGIVCRGGL